MDTIVCTRGLSKCMEREFLANLMKEFEKRAKEVVKVAELKRLEQR